MISRHRHREDIICSIGPLEQLHERVAGLTRKQIEDTGLRELQLCYSRLIGAVNVVKHPDWNTDVLADRVITRMIIGPIY